MKLKNKKTGEIGYLIVGRGCDHYVVANNEWKSCGKYDSLAKLSEEWEDYDEELKEYWCIDWTGDVNNIMVLDGTDIYEKDKKEIGNYFETEEEAEKAVEKLKALKRLKDKGFKFNGYDYEIYGQVYFNSVAGNITEIKKDLDLLFGGEDE